jgi:DNA-binding GntR family transcriptional regulator
MKLKQIKKSEPMVLKVVNILRTLILEGDLKAGEKLNETLIASQLSVSRSPVREALRHLESEGLVTNRAAFGTFVNDLSAKEIEEIYDVLSMIHVKAVQDATKFWSAAKQKQLRTIVEQEKRTFENENAKKSILAARKFHRFIVESAGNDLLLRLHDFVRNHEERGRFLTMTLEPDDLMQARQEHLAIARALLSNDMPKAIELIQKHYDGNCKRVLRGLSDKEGASLKKPKVRYG